MRLLVWLFRAFLFFALFAFALNNSQEVQVRWFFGHDWRAPLVIVVLIAFGIGCALGVLAMVPAWWKHRRDAQRLIEQPLNGSKSNDNPEPASPIRDGL